MNNKLIKSKNILLQKHGLVLTVVDFKLLRSAEEHIFTVSLPASADHFRGK